MAKWDSKKEQTKKYDNYFVCLLKEEASKKA